MDFIGGKARGSANGVVIGVFNAGKMDVPVVLVFVTYHGQHLCHSVVHTFHTSTTGVIGARRELMYPLQLAHGGRQSSVELRSIIGQEGGRTSAQRDEAVHQNVCGAFGGEFGYGDGEHVPATAKATREEEDV